MFNAINVYADLAELDSSARKQMEQSCQWMCDVDRLCLDRLLQDIYASMALHISDANFIAKPDRRAREINEAVSEARGLFDEIAEQVTHSLSLREAMEAQVLKNELPTMLTALESNLVTVRSILDEERSAAMQAEVEHRARHRARRQRLAALEAEQTRLQKTLLETSDQAKMLDEQLESALSTIRAERSFVFERFSKWDLLRRELSHVKHNQEGLLHRSSELELSFLSGQQMRSREEKRGEGGESGSQEGVVHSVAVPPPLLPSCVQGSMNWLRDVHRRCSDMRRRVLPVLQGAGQEEEEDDGEDLKRALGTTTSLDSGVPKESVRNQEDRVAGRSVSPGGGYAYKNRLSSTAPLRTPKPVDLREGVNPVRTPPPSRQDNARYNNKNNNNSGATSYIRAYDDDDEIRHMVLPNVSDLLPRAAALPPPLLQMPSMPTVALQQRMNPALHRLMERRDDVQRQLRHL